MDDERYNRSRETILCLHHKFEIDTKRYGLRRHPLVGASIFCCYFLKFGALKYNSWSQAAVLHFWLTKWCYICSLFASIRIKLIVLKIVYRETFCIFGAWNDILLFIKSALHICVRVWRKDREGGCGWPHTGLLNHQGCTETDGVS